MGPISIGDDANNHKRRINLEIREMEVDDLSYVFHLGERIFTSEKLPNLYRTWDEFEVVGFFNEEPEFCLVAEEEEEERIVGFAIGTTITKSRSAWKYGHLVWLGVDPNYQRLGIAVKLLNHFRDLMEKEGVRIILVDTDADNLPAIQFFKSMGFGHPEEHIYLTANLETMHRRPVKKKIRRRKKIGRARKKS